MTTTLTPRRAACALFICAGAVVAMASSCTPAPATAKARAQLAPKRYCDEKRAESYYGSEQKATFGRMVKAGYCPK